MINMQISGQLNIKPMRIESLYSIKSPVAAPDISALPAREIDVNLFKTVPANLVQSIRAFRVNELREEAARLQQHFLYAYSASAMTRQQVLVGIAQAFGLPRHCGKNFDILEHSLTQLVHKAGPQSGFLVVLEQLPKTPKFDKEARETLLDVFRDAADFWADKKVAFRVFYSFQ